MSLASTPATGWSWGWARLDRWITAFVVVAAIGGAWADWRTPALVVPATVVAVAGALGANHRGTAGLASCAVGVVALSVVCAPAPDNLGWFGVCVLVGWTGVERGPRPAAALAALALVCVAVADLNAPDGWGPWYAGVVFSAVVTSMAHQQRRLYVDLQAAQADLAEVAASRERARIARELHDVIGHSLTVSLLHVTSARLALAEDPAEAEAALAEAERLGQQSLAEVRHAVGLLRTDDPDGTRPLPGGGDLDDLVAGFRRAGVRLDWETTGDPAALPGTVGLALYRILQESLTNATRHAAGSPVRVRLDVGEDATELVVRSAGPARAARAGAGLTGMRERAEAAGGTLEAGPVSDGWQVRARLPVGVVA